MKFMVLCMICVLICVINFANSQNVKISARGISDSLCVNDRCLMKCCGNGKFIHKIIFERNNQLMRRTICDYFNDTKTSTLDEDFDDIFIEKPNLSIFEIKPDLFTANRTFRFNSIDVVGLGFNVYLNNHAEVLLEIPNAYDRWILVSQNMYCIDSIIEQDEKNASRQLLKPGVWTAYINVPEEVIRPTTTIMIVGMLVSCVFLALVLVIYGALPELRNLCGLILMAYVASQLGAFLMLVVMRIKSHQAIVCEGLTYVIYFFFLASFCWMNVMSYDIWWTFRGYAKARPIHRRGERFKFLMYCLYAFGLPLAMTIALGVLNNADLTHVPSFVTPKIPSGGCFIREGEKLLYLYTPMLILILCNWVLYIMTAVNIWRLSRGTAVLDSAGAASTQARRLNKRRFFIYLKLSVVMGLNWVLELMNYTSAGYVVWLVSDCYNILIGVSIFIIFVCKRNILRKLRKRFANINKSTWYTNQEDITKSASTDTSTVTQQIQVLPVVCYTAEGPEIIMKETEL